MDYNSVHQDGKSKPLQPQFQNNVIVWVTSFLTGVWLLMAVIYAWALTLKSGGLTSLVPTSTARAVVTLQILSGGTTFLLGQLVSLPLETVVWAAACSSSGITVASFLGTSPSTGLFGLLELLRWKPDGSNPHRFWVVTRYYHLLHSFLLIIHRLLFYVLVFAMGVIILSTYL